MQLLLTVFNTIQFIKNTGSYYVSDEYEYQG